MNSQKDIDTYKRSESHEKFHVFGKELDVYLKVLTCREGVPVCANDQANPGEPFFFMYTTVFKRLRLRLMEEAPTPIHWKATKISNWGNH